MWPLSADRKYRGLDPRQSKYNEQNFNFYYLRMLERITACLDTWMGSDLVNQQDFVPAILLFEPVTDPLWCDLGSGYGTGQTERAMKATKRAGRLFRKANRIQTSKPSEAKACREIARDILMDLPRPAAIWVGGVPEDDFAEFEMLADRLHLLYEGYLEEQRDWGGNARAKRLAIRLRAIFEHYSITPVTAGNDPGTPVGLYATCLNEVFDVIGLDAHFYRYARLAIDCTEQKHKDELTASYRFLREFQPY
jgi:hypothetical protein